MCIFNLLVVNLYGSQLNGGNAFMKGTCTSTESGFIDQQEATITKPFLPSIPALDIAAAYGNGTGSYSFQGGPGGTKTLTIKLVNINVSISIIQNEYIQILYDENISCLFNRMERPSVKLSIDI